MSCCSSSSCRFTRVMPARSRAPWTARPVPTERVYRGAVIGSGGIARSAHLPAFRQGAGVRDRVGIVANVDSGPVAPLEGLPLLQRPRKLERLVAIVDSGPVAPLEGLPLLQRPEELERLGAIDFIDVCTPTASHLELVLWGLERGCHVLCEKPVALTRADAARIAAAAGAAGRVVTPCHQYRYNPAWPKLREW